MMIDERALDDIGIGPDLPVSIDVEDVSLESALRLMLPAHDLTFLIKDEVLLVTTAEQAATIFEVRVYPINDTLLPEVLQQVIAPTSWASQGGEGTVVSYGQQFIVRQTYAVHAEINRLLLDLARDEEKTGGVQE